MATSDLYRFANPETLSAISPEFLPEFLAPWSPFLAAHGVALGPPGERGPPGAGPVDCDAVIRVLVAETASPPNDLVDALYLVTEMTEPDAADALREAAADHPELADVLGRSDLTAADLAVLVYLRARPVLDEVHARLHVRTRTSFETFASLRAPEDAMPLLDDRQIESMRLDIESGLVRLHRGDVRVLAFEEAAEHRYLVRRGEPYRRKEVLIDGRAVHLFYREVKWDVVTLDPRTGVLRINADGVRIKDLYRRKLGLHLLGHEEQFPKSETTHTLAPLLDGPTALHCGDIAGIDAVQLVGICWRCPRVRGGMRIYKADDDVFALLRAEGVDLPTDPDVLLEGRFRVLFSDSSKPRPAVVRVPNVARLTRDRDAQRFENYLRARGFSRIREKEGGRAQQQALLAFS